MNDFLIFLITVFLILLNLFLLRKITGASLFTALITYPVEYFTNYRIPLPLHSICDGYEQNDIAKHLSSHFTSITRSDLYHDKFGWQIAIFNVVLPTTEISKDIRLAIEMDVRNYLLEQHGIDNPCIIVPALNENSLHIYIATSPKAKEMAKSLNFSTQSGVFAPVEEIIE